MDKEHYCTEDKCKCPKCGSALYYSKKYNQHTCYNRQCMWIETWAYDEVSSLTQEQRDYINNRIKK